MCPAQKDESVAPKLLGEGGPANPTEVRKEIFTEALKALKVVGRVGHAPGIGLR